MRVYFLILLILVAMAWSVRHWLVGVCAVIALSALLQHEDMPHSLGGITGFSPVNFLLGWTILMWLVQRNQMPRQPRLGPVPRLLAIAYITLMAFAFLRGVLDISSIQGPESQTELATSVGFTVEYLINPLKYLLPALLVYLGIHTRKQYWMVLAALTVMTMLFAVVVVRNVPLRALLDESLALRVRPRIQKQAGLHANDMALVMVQAFWALLLYVRFSRHRWHRIAALAVAGVTVVVIGMCQSRGGFLAFVVTGVVLAAVCWRKLFLAFVPGLVLIGALFPTIPARMMTGFGIVDVAGHETHDVAAVGGGRLDVLWPAAVAEISTAPLLGQGRLTILRTSMYGPVLEGEGVCPTHPHNAYLEVLLDGGLIALIVVGLCLAGVLLVAVRMARAHDAPLTRFTGAVALSVTSAFLVMALSGQSFWPRESLLPTACIIALGLRYWTWYRRGLSAASPAAQLDLTVAGATTPGSPVPARARMPANALNHT